MALAMLATASAAVAAPTVDGPPGLADKAPPGLEQRPKNADLPAPDWSNRPEAPQDWNSGNPANIRFADMSVEDKVFDPSLEAEFRKWAPIVDRVLTELYTAAENGEVNYDFTVGIDAWGAPIFTADSDETEAFIRSLFPPGIAAHAEIERKSNVSDPSVGITPPEQDRRLKDDGSWHYGGGGAGFAGFVGSDLYLFHGCTLGFSITVTKTNGEKGNYMTLPDHCVRSFSQAGHEYGGILTSPGSNVWVRSAEDGANQTTSSAVANRYIGFVKTHKYGTGYGERSYKWNDLSLISGGSAERLDGYIWQSDPRCWVTSNGCQHEEEQDAWNVRRVITSGGNYGTFGVSTSKFRGSIEGIHYVGTTAGHRFNDCDTPDDYYGGNQAIIPTQAPWNPSVSVACADADFNGYPDRGYGASYDLMNQAGTAPVTYTFGLTTSCECGGFIGGVSGSPVYRLIGDDDASIIGMLVSAEPGDNQAEYIPVGNIIAQIEADSRFTDAYPALWWQGYELSPSWP